MSKLNLRLGCLPLGAYLHKTFLPCVHRSTVPFEKSAVCNLCNVVLYIPLDLCNHLGEDVHLEKERELEIAKNNYMGNMKDDQDYY